MESWDAIVVGSGPNGLAAGIRLLQHGASVLIVEGADTPGGGMRTAPLTLPGFNHDVCSACHPTGVLSPFFRTLPLERHGLSWVFPDYSVAHPLDDGPPVLLQQDVAATAEGLGIDAAAYRSLVEPLLHDPDTLFADLLAPLGVPRDPLTMARFGWRGWRSATLLARWFRGPRARALLAGCAAHAIQPLDNLVTGALGLVFLLAAHVKPWPVARGGSAAITDALVAHFRALGGELRCGTWIRSLDDLPPSRAVIFDTDPHQLAQIAGDALPARFRRTLTRYRMGPAAFKLDWALDGPIPWRDDRIQRASTVHLGGTLEEIAAAEGAMYRGEHPERPYVLLVQQSAIDPTRAPEGQHTGYAYIHVPAGSERDQTDVLEAQVERFAPGFRDRILARHVTRPRDFQALNPNYLGGAVTGGTGDLLQLFTRPSWNPFSPYATPNPRLWIGSASSPPGGGVHGMCGYHAANAVAASLAR